MVKKGEMGLSLDSDDKPRKRMTAAEREEVLIENFVGLQRAMTNLSIKFSGLSDNINRLLQIFEESAKNLSGSFMKPEDTDMNKDMIKKIDSLLDQNKTIAQGLVIMEEKLRSKIESEPLPHNEITKPRPRPLPNL
ncbi:MAG: hypothetical protein WC548_00945 [Candidatus Pacearchaeota archaeon]